MAGLREASFACVEIYHERCFWSISVHQKPGSGAVSTICLDTDPDSANLDMKDCFSVKFKISPFSSELVVRSKTVPDPQHCCITLRSVADADP